MPWSEISPMDQKVRFIADYQRDLFTVCELCDRYGISRRPGTSGSVTRRSVAC